jgi:hypothetical protein
MALATSCNWDTALIMDYGKTTRNLRDAGETYFNLIESTESKTLECRAVDADAAEGEVETNTQPDAPATGTHTYSYSMQLTNEVLRSYTVRRVEEKKSITFADPPD